MVPDYALGECLKPFFEIIIMYLNKFEEYFQNIYLDTVYFLKTIGHLTVSLALRISQIPMYKAKKAHLQIWISYYIL